MALRPSRAFILVLFALALTTAASAQVIKGCVDPSGSLRIVASAQTCKPSEYPLTWNAVGPQGPAGAQGPAGPQGPPGVSVQPPQALGTVTIDNLPPFSTYEFTGGVTVATSTGGSGAGAGKATFSPIVVTKTIDTTTGALFQKAVTGELFAKVTIAITGTQLQVVLSNVQVGSDDFVRLKGSNTVYERVTLNYEKLELLF